MKEVARGTTTASTRPRRPTGTTKPTRGAAWTTRHTAMVATVRDVSQLPPLSPPSRARNEDAHDRACSRHGPNTRSSAWVLKSFITERYGLF